MTDTISTAGFEVVEDARLTGCGCASVTDPFGNRIELMQPTG